MTDGMTRRLLIPVFALSASLSAGLGAGGVWREQPAPAAAPSASAEARRAVEETLAEMTRVVREGDGPAYVTHVIPGGGGGDFERRFRKEQENWAADLKDHKPLEFELAVGAGPSTFATGRSTFELVMTYRMDVGAATKRTKASWPAVFVELAIDDNAARVVEAPTRGTARGTRWLYAGEDWRTMDGDGFAIKYFEGSESVAKDVLAAFPKAKAHDDEGFEIVNHAPQTIKVYTSMEHLKATVYLSMPDKVLGGWNEPGESIKFLTSYTRGVDRWAGAFAHEYGHVATWELGPKANDMPWWVMEGVAELGAADLLPGYDARTQRLIRSLAAQDRLARWEDIADYRTSPAPLKHLAYHQGYCMAAYISDRWGRKGRNDWLRAMAMGDSLDGATRRVFQMSFEDLDRAWRGQIEGPAPEAAAPPKNAPEPKTDREGARP